MRKVLVWGMAKSGIAAAKLLAESGLFVRINDIKTRAQLDGELSPLEGLKIEDRLGEDVMNCLEGIDTLVISPGIPADHKAARAARESGIEVISEIELAYRFSKGKLIAVTGTNGKTTTTTLLGEIMKAWDKHTCVVGNIGEPYANHSLELTDDSVTVCENSSFQLETIAEYKPNISLILNLTEDHLNRHRTMENYGRIKQRIFMNQDKSDTLVLNLDDALTRAMAANAKCNVIWFSRLDKPDKGAFVEGECVVYTDGSTKQRVLRADEIRIPGPHNLENALAAVAAAMAFGVPAGIIASVLRSFPGVEHRIETVRTVDGITYINDSKGTNPDSTIKAVQSMKLPTVILLGGSEKNSDYSEMCQVIKNSAVKYAVCLGATGEAIQKALTEAGFTDSEYVGYDFEKAIFTARAHCIADWNVLLSPACASFDMFRDFEHRGEEFKRIVNAM